MTKFIDKCFAGLDKALVWILSILFGAMSIVIFMQVIWRYIFKAPLSWSEELARFLFVWVSFIGAVTAARRGNHIGMEMLREALPRAGDLALRLVSNLITVFFFAVTCYCTLGVAPRMLAQYSPAMEMPMFYPYAGIAVGSFFLMVYYANEGIKNLIALAGGEK